jgi:ribose 5-phosphate isomerase B
MIYLASDHAGFELKKQIGEFLKEMNLDFEDVGPHTYDAQDDYPDFIIPAAEKVAEKPMENKGIVLGGSGQGEALAANKVKGVRAALYYGGSTDIITLSRVHNNANILSLGARFLTMDEIKEVIKLWLATDFTEEERHARRLDKILDYEMKK